MAEQTLNRMELRALAEEIQSSLFPREGRDGRVPYPMPVVVRFKPNDNEYIVRFTSERTYRWVGEAVPDVSASMTRVEWDGFAFSVDLEMGKEPDLPELGDGDQDEQEAFVGLLRAVAGVL